MNWLTNFVRPKIQALMQRNEVPENLWTKCTSCDHMLFHRDLAKNLFVCHYCNHHMPLEVEERFKSLFDNEVYKRLETPKVVKDPLHFKDTKKYVDRLKEYRAKTNEEDALALGQGKINGCPAVVAIMNFKFMGGSMGMAVGDGLLVASEAAVKSKAALIVLSASGGARMQEGILSLMQMPRTIIAVDQVKEAGLPFINIFTNPTTGGVSASFAMVGDIALAEPNALIGFAGPRVIEETIKRKLPEGFQRSEYLKDHGMIDCVVERSKLKEKLGTILSLLMPYHR